MALGTQLRDQLGAAYRVGSTGLSTSTALDQPGGTALGLGGLVALALRRAQCALRAIPALDR